MRKAQVKHYDVFEDIKKYPDATIIIAYSRRSVGKTYGALWGAYERNIKVAYLKRTNRDIDTLCKPLEDYKASPYSPINRDHGTRIYPKKTGEGFAAFHTMDKDFNIEGPAISIAFSLSGVKDIKGFDLSDCDLMIMDEFIPQATETRVLTNECDGMLDAYLTISRDRIERGRGAMKLLLFANAESLYCPIVDGLELMSELSEVSQKNLTYKYIENRRILIHNINDIELDESVKQDGMYICMYGTKWWRKSYLGEFADADFSNVKKVVLKKYQPLIHMRYRDKDYFIYRKDRDYHVCDTSSNRYRSEFNLDRDNDVRAFYGKYVFDIQEACTMGHVTFSDYFLYDLIMNFDKRFKKIL